MSAAEKLKALDGARGEFAWEESIQKFSLFGALPQIVAVVEAAEAEASLHQYPADLASCPNPVCVALSALDEALGDVT